MTICAGSEPVGSDPIRTKLPSRQAYNEIASSVASTLASTGPWFVSTATMSREGWPGLIVIGRIERARLLRPSSSPEDVPGPIDHQDIVNTVAGQVRHDGGGLGGGDKRSGGSERPVQVQQHRHVVGAAVGDGQVGPAVAVEVARHEGDWLGPHRVGHLGLEGAVAVAQQHRHVVGAVVGDGQVGPAVAVEVARHEGVWLGPHRVGHLGLEGAVAVAQQHRHVVGAVVGDGQVGPAVAVEVARHEGDWLGPHRVGHLGLEGAVAVAQQAPTRRWSRCWRRPGRSGRRR